MPEACILLFDIDGTLVNLGPVGRNAMFRAFSSVGVAAKDYEGMVFGGATDLGLVGQVQGRSHQEFEVQTIFRRYVAFLSESLPEATPNLCPGVVALLRGCLQSPNHWLGLGTGNLMAGALLKLQAVDIDRFFSFGGFGDDAACRTELLGIARERGLAALGVTAADVRVVVVGDTLRDIESARGIGAEVIAVATGGPSLEDLREGDPDVLVPTLEDRSVYDFLDL